jgi:hypothetical protein
MKLRLNLLLLCGLLAWGCQERLPSLSNFDQKAWQNDKMGCQGQRLQSFESLLAQKQSLMGLSQKKLMALLGKPDEQRLHKRNQKYYVYYLEGSASCKAAQTRYLLFRFSALDNITEVLLKEE